MADIPEDVLRLIFSFLPQETLVQCRFLSRSVEPLARALAFRSVRLERGRDVNLFRNITKSERLRPFVRELTLDISQGGLPDRDAVEYPIRFNQHRKTLLALPLVRYFRGLRTLNLRYGRSNGDGYSGRWRVDDDGVKTDERLLPLLFTTIYTETVLRCISGSWTREAQDLWERRWRRWTDHTAEGRVFVTGLQSEWEFFGAEQSFPEKAINLTTLTISNLSEKDSEYLMSSAAMKRFLETQSLSKLQLLTNSEKWDGDSLVPFTIHNRYKFFENLPSTWLSPPIADRLRTLSLYANDYWGWSPKMDFRVLSQGKNGTGGLSNLRTLALGTYVFSHPWQVDWVAQLGSNNGRGGLEELYLDNCPLIWYARIFGPLDTEDFPPRETIAAEDGNPAATSLDRSSRDFRLRWCDVLQQWRQEMPYLKVFKMGNGDWLGELSKDVALAQTASRTQVVDGAHLLAKHRNEDTMHMNYDKVSIEDIHKHDQDVIKDGVGISQRRECVLQYVHYMAALGPAPWVERDFKDALVRDYEDGYQRYEEARRKDEDALYALRAAVASR